MPISSAYYYNETTGECTIKEYLLRGMMESYDGQGLFYFIFSNFKLFLF